MTKTGSRSGLWSLIAVCLVAAAGLAMMRGTWDGLGRTAVAGGDELVSFVVTFEPARRDHMVTVTMTATKGPVVETRRDSPWVHEAMVPAGTVVSVSAVQTDDGLLACKIRKGLKKLAEDSNAKSKGHAVVCKATT